MRTWLLSLDAALPKPFVRRLSSAGEVDPRDAELARALLAAGTGGSAAPDDAAATAASGGSRVFADYPFFVCKLGAEVEVQGKKGKKGLAGVEDTWSVSAVWTEIVTHIKGSQAALREAKGCLSRKQYTELSAKAAPALATRRSEAYDIFLKYEKVKREHGAADLCDVIHHVYSELLRAGPRAVWTPPTHVFLDEVQVGPRPEGATPSSP
jgi:hypothetical protein